MIIFIRKVKRGTVSGKIWKYNKRYREQGELTVEVAFKLKTSVEIVVLWENDD